MANRPGRPHTDTSPTHPHGHTRTRGRYGEPVGRTDVPTHVTVSVPTHVTVPDPVARPRAAGVAVLRWPDDAEERMALAQRGEPCVLVVDGDTPAPNTTLLEDWVRAPFDQRDLTARCEAVKSRATCGAAPTLDDGLLVHRGAWAAIPEAQVGMVELLVDRLGEVVRKDELAAAAAASGGSDHESAVKAAVARLGRRLAPLGLELRSIRGRGYLLQIADACPVHGTRSAIDRPATDSGGDNRGAGTRSAAK